MLTRNLPKLFITMLLIGSMAVITSCTRPQNEQTGPTGGAGQTDMGQGNVQQNQTCPMANQTR